MAVGEEEDHHQSPLLRSSDEPEEPLKRTGTAWSAVAHIITGVIGAGVLSLAWSVAQLGWIVGPLLIIVFALITIVSTNLLCDCYRYPDPQRGPSRVRSYMDAVKLHLGEKMHIVCGVVVQESLYGNGIAYTITAASSISHSYLPVPTLPPYPTLPYLPAYHVSCKIADDLGPWYFIKPRQYNKFTGRGPIE